MTPGLTAKLDWLNVTLPVERLDVVRAILSDHLGNPELQTYGRRHYSQMWTWPTGADLCFSPDLQHCSLSLNGDSVDTIPLTRVRSIVQDLVDLGGRCSRLDSAVDDYDRLVPLDLVHQAAEQGNFAGFRRTESQKPRKRVDGQMQLVGDGVTFGRRGNLGAGKFLNVYDKTLETEGQVDCIRWEARFADARAADALVQLAAAQDDEAFARMLGALVGGTVDFIDRSETAHGHLDRMPRLAWWQSFLDRLTSLPLVVNRVVPPLQKFVQWCERAVFPSLALVKVVLESSGYDARDIIWGLICRAESRIPWQSQAKRQLGLNISECFG